MWISFTKKPMNPMIANPIAVAMAIFWNSFLSGLVHLLTSRIESFTNCRLGSTNCITWSMFVGWQFERVETRSLGERVFSFYCMEYFETCGPGSFPETLEALSALRSLTAFRTHPSGRRVWRPSNMPDLVSGLAVLPGSTQWLGGISRGYGSRAVGSHSPESLHTSLMGLPSVS